ncbi:MAG: hypothetical protein AB7S26_28595 [Sandaracinaceae bacterium]
MQRVWPIAIAAALAACTDVPTDETPSGALRLFLDALERAEREPAAMEDAFWLLDEATRESLAERARLAGSLGGPELEPWEMIVRGRYRLSFTPAPGTQGMRERIDGTDATVVVTEAEGSRRAEVPLVNEDGHWRVRLSLPSRDGPP